MKKLIKIKAGKNGYIVFSAVFLFLIGLFVASYLKLHDTSVLGAIILMSLLYLLTVLCLESISVTITETELISVPFFFRKNKITLTEVTKMDAVFYTATTKSSDRKHLDGFRLFLSGVNGNLININISSFGKTGTAQLIRAIHELNPDIALNDTAKYLEKANWKPLRSAIIRQSFIGILYFFPVIMLVTMIAVLLRK